MFWVDRYGFIEEGKGLVYGKSQRDMNKTRTITLKGKKLMKGKRKVGNEYLAICTSKDDNIEIKISFDDKGDIDRWAKIMAFEVADRPIPQEASPSKEVKPTQNLSTSVSVRRPKGELIEESKGDTPIEDVTPKASKVKQSIQHPKIPGYVSRFTQFLADDDKQLIETAEDMYTSRTDWNIDRAGSASLYYTSKTLKTIEDEYQASQGIAKKDDDERTQNQKLIEELMVPGSIALVAAAYLLSFILPGFLNFLVAVAIAGASGFMLFKQKVKLEDSDEKQDAPFKSYKVKVVSNVVGLPDDIANALINDDKRKDWDLISKVLKEKPSKVVCFRKSQAWCQIYEQRVSQEGNKRELFIDISKIKGKPYFLKLSCYSTVNSEMHKKIGWQGVKNNLNALRNYCLVEDSLAEMNISVTNFKGDGDSIVFNPTLTITDMIAEIEEMDMGEDAMTEQDVDEDFKEGDIMEEMKEPKLSNASYPPIEPIPVPPKELTFDEKFELEISKAPKNEQIFIRKAKNNIEALMQLAEDPGWKQINQKGTNIVYSMDAPGGLKCIKGEGYIDFAPKEVCEYLKRPNVQKDYDDQFAEGGVVEVLSMETQFIFNRFKGVFLVDGRDFCMLAITIRKPDGQIIICSKSHEHDDCPPHKKYVRGELIIGGWILNPVEGNPSKTFTQYITQSDLKGSIPKSIVNSVSEKQGLLITKVGESMKKNY